MCDSTWQANSILHSDPLKPDSVRLFAAEMLTSVDVCFVFIHINLEICLFEEVIFVFSICVFIFGKWKKTESLNECMRM